LVFLLEIGSIGEKFDMSQNLDTSSSILARLTMSALKKATKDPSCWSNPNVYKALIVSGLNLLVASNELLLSDLESSSID
tara:strand:+ start:511 stop:750 length:240 start_codon:yes stop_codon:yes gene_type:complete